MTLKPEQTDPDVLFNTFYVYRGKYDTTLYTDFFTQRILYYYSSSHNNSGLEYARAGKHSIAKDHYLAALRIDPEMTESWNNLGTMAYAQKRYDDAIDCFRKAALIKPTDSSFIYNIGLTYKQMNKLGLAEQELTKINNYPAAMNELGLIAIAKGEFDRAIEILTELINKTPGYSVAYYNLGLAYQNKNQPGQAVDNYQKYRAFVTEPAEKAQVQALIRKLTK
jgi:tetratricopeptide (TPR) repeat protein